MTGHKFFRLLKEERESRFQYLYTSMELTSKQKDDIIKLIKAKSKPAAELLQSLGTIEIWPPEDNDDWWISIGKLEDGLDMGFIFKFEKSDTDPLESS